MLRYFLDIEVMRSKYGIFLSQKKYVLDLLSKIRKLGVKPCSFPIVLGIHLIREGKTFKNPERYRRLVGKVNYLTVTRPDIAHSVNTCSLQPVNHWTVVEQILCYLKGALRRGILYNNHGHNKIECFSNADRVGSKEDGRSTLGYYVFVGGNIVLCKSKKQNVVSQSSADSEYRAMTQFVCEIM